MSEGKREKLYLTILLILITVFSCHYIRQKRGFYVDEGMTLYLSNGTYTGAVTTVPEATIIDFLNDYVIKDTLPATVSNVEGMLKDVTGAGDYSVKGTVEWYDAAREVLQGRNTWMSGNKLFDSCTASRDNRFNYLQVYINQMMDVHPCVYYFIVHTVFSVFAGMYSPYLLFGINIACLLITCILMYRLSRELGLTVSVSLLGVALYGFSQGFVSCAVFFRMYAMETLLVVATFCFYMTLKNKDYELVRRDYLILGLIEIIGFNVHYYYIIYLAALFAVVLTEMIRKKKRVGKYILSQAVTGIISLIVWPFSLYHILFGYRGTEAFSRLKTFGIFKSIADYIGLCIDSLFFGRITAAGIAIAFILLLLYGKRRIKREEGVERQTENSSEEKKMPIKEMIIPMVVYLVLVGKVAPSASARYVMCLFPFMILCAVMAVSAVLSHLGINGKHRSYVCLSLAMLYIVCTFIFKQPDYLYPEMDRKLGTGIDRSKTNCLMIASEHYKGFPYLLKLSEFDQVMVVDSYLLDTVKDIKPANMNEDMILYIDNTLDKESVLEELDEYGYLADKDVGETDSDLIDFAAFLLKAE